MSDETFGYAAICNGRLYAYGANAAHAMIEFRRQIAGADNATRFRMLHALEIVRLDADAASEAAECIDAPWIVK